MGMLCCMLVYLETKKSTLAAVVAKGALTLAKAAGPRLPVLHSSRYRDDAHAVDAYIRICNRAFPFVPGIGSNLFLECVQLLCAVGSCRCRTDKWEGVSGAAAELTCWVMCSSHTQGDGRPVCAHH